MLVFTCVIPVFTPPTSLCFLFIFFFISFSSLVCVFIIIDVDELAFPLLLL